MRKFVLLPLFFGLSLAQVSFAQVRDLFDEFEKEAGVPAAPAVETPAPAAPASSAAVQTPAPVTPASSAAVVLSSSSVAVVVPASSSSLAPLASSSSVADAMSSAVDVAPAIATVDTAVLDSATRDSLMREAAIADAERVRAIADSTRKADSLAQAQAAGLTNLSSSSVAASSNSMSRRELLGPVKVSKVNGIDEMKGRYKNPRKALFLSLLVPGAGQMYVGGNTSTYVRGGVYIALEVFLWSGWGYNSIYKYNQQVDKYKKFAKEHFSIGRYERAMRDLYDAGGSLYPSTFRNRYMNTRKSFCEAIYGDASACYQESELFAGSEPHFNRFSDKNKKLGDEMRDFKKSFANESELFQLISEGSYVRGWDDVKDGGTLINDLNLEDDNADVVPLGESQNLNKYRDMRSKANDYADRQVWFIGGLILNHIVSAVDAALTANAHNKVLYEEDVSWYERLHFDSGMSFKDSFSWTVRANWGF
jgi:3-oxoacyl-[acyl-carrier protein] reductase